MRKSFLTNLLFAVAVNLAIKPIYLFGVEVGVQNTLGAKTYGLYFALLNSAFLLQIINDFGLQIFNNRQVAIDKTNLVTIFPSFIVLKLVLSSLYIVLLYIFGGFLGLEGALPLLLLIGINMVLTSFVLFLRSGVSGLGYYRIDSVLSVLDKLLMLIIIGGMLIVIERQEFTIYHFVWGQMGALFCTLVISWLLLLHYSPPFGFGQFGFGHLLSLLKQAFPYALAVFLMTLYTRVDGVMISRLLPDGDYEAGIYAAGYRILDALNMGAFLFAAMLLPMFSEAQSSPSQLRRLLDEGFRYVLILVIPVCVFGFLFRNEVMMALYQQADAYWGVVFVFLLLTFVPMGLMYVFGTFLTASGRVTTMNTIFFVTVLLNILLNFLLIPQFKAVGAAVATLITQLFAVAGILVLSSRIFSLAAIRESLLRLLGFFVFCLGLGLLLIWFDLAWFWAFCAFIPAVIMGAFLFNLVRRHEVVSLFKNT